jgi:signal peptidase II
VLLADQATKFWAVTSLTGRAPIPVLGQFLSLQLIYNPGAAFSIGRGTTWIFTGFAAAAVVVLWRLAARTRTTAGLVVLGLLLGGAVTHLLDRLFRPPGFGVGHVVDFINYNGWFIGNVADIALVLGAATLALLNVTGTETWAETWVPNEPVAETAAATRPDATETGSPEGA